MRMKTIAILMALCVVMGLRLTVSAQLSIVDPDTKGTIVINKYAVENPEDYTVAANGEDQTEAVEGLDPLPNISFTVTRMMDNVREITDNRPFVGEGEYNETEITDGDGQAVFDGLAHGVYRVHEEPSSAVKAPVEDFLVDVPTTNPAGNGWIYRINVYPKNQLIGKPGLNLYVTQENNKSQPVHQGGTATWIAASEIPADIGTAGNYQVVLTPGAYLTYEADSVSVSTRDRDDGVVPLGAGDYTFTPEEGGQLLLDLTAAGRTKLAGVAQDGFTPVLYTQYLTRLDIPQEALAGMLAQKVESSAQLRYTNAIDIPYTGTMEGEVLPYVYTGGLVVEKIDNRSEQLLAGATFKLYRSLDDIKAGENAVLAPDGKTDWELTTGENGQVAFLGLAYGDTGDSPDTAETSLYLVETQAPVGYNLMPAPKEVKVNYTSHVQENRVIVRDNTGFTLPSTGGIGTLWFTGGGLLLVGLAVWLFLRSRRKNRDAR